MSLTCSYFKGFSLVFGFQKFDYDESVHEILFGSVLFAICWDSWSVSLCLSWYLRSFQPSFLYFSLCTIIFLLLSGTLIEQLFDLLLLSHILLRLCPVHFSIFFFWFCRLDSFYDLSSSLLNLYSVISILWWFFILDIFFSLNFPLKFFIFIYPVPHLLSLSVRN